MSIFNNYCANIGDCVTIQLVSIIYILINLLNLHFVHSSQTLIVLNAGYYETIQ